MRTREAFTISLPPAMSQAVERARKAERRTRSEIVRDALRLYFNPALALRIARLPVYTPTARELRELEKGRLEMRRGELLTLDEFFSHLESPAPKARPKGRRPRSAT
jgi:Arc/MetJ-type ribon-helix-helix transcriptional regulator